MKWLCFTINLKIELAKSTYYEYKGRAISQREQARKVSRHNCKQNNHLHKAHQSKPSQFLLLVSIYSYARSFMRVSKNMLFDTLIINKERASLFSAPFLCLYYYHSIFVAPINYLQKFLPFFF